MTLWLLCGEPARAAGSGARAALRRATADGIEHQQHGASDAGDYAQRGIFGILLVVHVVVLEHVKLASNRVTARLALGLLQLRFLNERPRLSHESLIWMTRRALFRNSLEPAGLTQLAGCKLD